MIKNTSPILSALRAATLDEKAAVEFFEKQRWGDQPACPRCWSLDVYQMKSKNGERNKDYRWRCRDCEKFFTVRTETVFEETRLPMRIWAYAIWKACSSKKGISALQLSREMEITHKSALFILRRIRHGMGEQYAPKMTGTIEVDEVTFSTPTEGFQKALDNVVIQRDLINRNAQDSATTRTGVGDAFV